MIPIPPLDPMPVPAPVWLLKVLLWVTFSVHLLLMNLVLGGGLLAAVFAFRGREKDLSVARTLAKSLPYVMAFAITFGVAPLLFVQVLYGPLFYTASILMATPFLAIVGVLIAAYYLMYFMGWKWSRLGKARGWIASVIFLLLAYVGFTYTNVFSLMWAPERFKDMYLASPGGLQFHFGEATLLPRFLHTFLGAIAVAGLFVAYFGTRRLKLEPELGRWQFKIGVTWFAAATVVNMGVGAWWLVALPRLYIRLFMGGSAFATAAFIAGLAFGMGALATALLGINSLKPLRLLMASVHSLTAAIVCMVLMRDSLRDAQLQPEYVVSALPVSPQWWAIALFLALFVGGLALCAWLLRISWKALRASRLDGEDLNRGPGFTDSGLHKISAEDSQAMRGGVPPGSPPNPGQRPTG